MKYITQFLILFFVVPVFTYSQDTLRAAESNSPGQIYLSTRSDGKDYKKIILEWSCAPLSGEQFFTIERSRNGISFDVIGVIKGKAGQAMFDFTDELPASNNNFYRVKTSVGENNFIYSKIVSKGISVAQFCRFYPNPVEKLLIVRTENAVELKILDQLNNVRISKQLPVGLQLVDVSGLEKGLYVITIFHKESNRLITDKLIKN